MLQKRSIPILVFIFLCLAACEEPEDAVLPTNDFIPTPPCEGICCEDPSSCGLDPGVPDDDEVDRTGLTITGSGTDDDPYVYSFKIFYEYDYSGTTDPVGAYLNHLSNGNYYAPEGFIIDGLYHKRGHYREPKDNEGPTAIIKRKGFKGSKADCVYKLLTNGGEFSKFIKRFDGDFPVSHLIFELSTTIPGNGRTTDDPTSYFITIQINANTLNSRPTLGVARTIAHEVIHAEMDRKLKSIGYDAQIAGKAFPGIYDYYRRYVKGWQHQQMQPIIYQQ